MQEFFLDHHLFVKSQESWLAGVHEPWTEYPSIFPDKQNHFHAAQNKELAEGLFNFHNNIIFFL